MIPEYATVSDGNSQVLLNKDSLAVVQVRGKSTRKSSYIAFANDFCELVEDNDVSSNFDRPWEADSHSRHYDDEIPYTYGFYFSEMHSDDIVDEFFCTEPWTDNVISSVQQIKQ